MKPTMIINFKAYSEATGPNAVKLAKIIEEVALENDINMILSVQPADIYRVKNAVSIPVFAQHIDNVEHGKYTGHVTAESVKANGATGTLLNHSEKPMDINSLKKSVEYAKKIGLKTVICVEDEKTAFAVAAFEPDMISIEPSELISTGVAVSLVKPDMVKNSVKFVHKLKKIRVLCGAGIRNPEDIIEAINLGARGVLISSSVVLSEDPKKYLTDMAKAFTP